MPQQQRDTRLIGGIYLQGQTITSAGLLTTYAANNHNTNEMVGLTVIDIPPGEPLEIVQHLIAGYQLRQQVLSPHVLPLYHWGIDGNRIYIATAPHQGVTLQYIVDHEDIDVARALDLTRQITQGIKAFHDHGLPNLDLRPQYITVKTTNITDNVQIDDIGLRSLLQSLHVTGTERTDNLAYLDPRYMSPEHIQHGITNQSSDLYLIGILFFLLVTGRLPFVGRNSAETGILQTTGPIPQMSQFNHKVPALFQAVLNRLLAKNPEERFANAEQLLQALDSLQSPSATGSQTILAQTQEQGETREIKPVQKDISLKSTLIQDKSKSSPTMHIPDASGIYAYLCYEGNEVQEVRRVPLTRSNSIVGRMDPKRKVTPDIDLSPFDPRMSISRLHARIYFTNMFFYVEDLKSRNQTRLGELVLTPLKAEILQHNDTLSFGSVRMRFIIAGQE